MSQPLPPDFYPFQEEEEPYTPPVKRKMKPGAKTFLLTLLLLFALAVILYAGVFRIRKIAVVGNETVSWNEVVEAAGLENGISYFAVNPEKIRQAIEMNRYLVCEKIELFFPNAMTLYLRERKPCANVQVMGISYLMDEDGMALEREDNGIDESKPVVTGLQTREIRIGKTLVPASAEQMNIYTELITELQLQQFLGEVSELNLSNQESLYLITCDGYTVRLGDAEDLRAKIGTVRGVISKLREMGKHGGMIEASIPEVATYTPMEM